MNLRAPVLLTLAGLCLTGCVGGKTPVTTVWSLPAPRSESPSVNPDGPALGVERFTSVAALRTTSLTYREGDGRQIKTYPYHRWADYPDRLLHERLMTRLLLSGVYESVTQAPPRRGLDGILAVRLVEFDEWDEASGVRVTVGLRWSLEDADGERLASGLARSEQDASKDAAAVVEAYERATAEVLASIAERVAELLSED